MAVQRSKNHNARRSRHSRCVDERISLSTTSTSEKNSVENLDEETRAAKRHLTKEMWQLVSIAVKRMADELVTISNQQQTTIAQPLPPSPSIQPLSTESVSIETTDAGMQTTTMSKMPSNTIVSEIGGAGDILATREKIPLAMKSIKKRTLPIHMLECSSKNKKKESSNNAIQRPNKSKKPKKSTKKVHKAIKHSSSSTHK